MMGDHSTANLQAAILHYASEDNPSWTVSASRISYTGNQVYFEGGHFAIAGKDGKNAVVRRGVRAQGRFSAVSTDIGTSTHVLKGTQAFGVAVGESGGDVHQGPQGYERQTLCPEEQGCGGAGAEERLGGWLFGLQV